MTDATIDNTTFNIQFHATDNLIFDTIKTITPTQYFLIYDAPSAGGQPVFDSRDEIFYLSSPFRSNFNLLLNPVDWDLAKATFEVYIGDSTTPVISSSSPPFESPAAPNEKVLVKVTGSSSLPSSAYLEFQDYQSGSGFVFDIYVPNSMVISMFVPMVFISEPVANSSYISGTDIDVKLSTTPFTFVNSVIIKCGNNLTNPVKVISNVGSSTALNIPIAIYGSCSLIAATDINPTWSASMPITIDPYLIIEFDYVPVNFVQGIPFDFIVKTVSAANVSATTNFKLTCNGSAQDLLNVQFNTIQTFIPNFAFLATNGPYSCTLSNVQNPQFNNISYSAPLLVPLDQAEQAVVAKSFAIAGGGFA